MLGVSKKKNLVSFSIFSKNATSVKLRLFYRGKSIPFAEHFLKKSGDLWSIKIDDLPNTFEYTYRCDGPYDPKNGHFFNKEQDLVDPYSRELNFQGREWGFNKMPIRGLVSKEVDFDWGLDSRPMIPLDDLIIYEMHVRGFTIHKSSNVNNPGKFLGIIEKIPYLKRLGINAVELMPVHNFSESKTENVSCNYWGYSTTNFFVPMVSYGNLEDFKQLVKALHSNGIEVILDVVYNHTSEGACKDYYYSFRGIDNAIYYMIDDNGGYSNYSGCGNTLNCNHPVVQDLIIDSLRYFVTEFHVDGFRFDLASILSRDLDGKPIENPPILDRITKDPILAPAKLIAEPWDGAGIYQVGSFPSWKFCEWNDKFRDDIRRFLRGDGVNSVVKNRIFGSKDIYDLPFKSINYITCHDGFSLHDIFSYSVKHNEENGEENLDGIDENFSSNCGIEGVTNDRTILSIRKKQMKNAFTIVLLSNGIPMILMGDEYGHTKYGNNNTWCHDNELNYFLWDRLDGELDLFEFVVDLIKIRKSFIKKWEIKMCSCEEDKFLSFIVDEKILVISNPSDEKFDFVLPRSRWIRMLDSSLSFQEKKNYDSIYTIDSHSCAVLIAI